MSRLNVKCPECGRINRTERNDYKVGDRIWLICHGCEACLSADFCVEALFAPNPHPIRRTA